MLYLAAGILDNGIGNFTRQAQLVNCSLRPGKLLKEQAVSNSLKESNPHFMHLIRAVGRRTWSQELNSSASATYERAHNISCAITTLR